MIYLDHAATSFPKPGCAVDAMYAAARNCAGYGRSSHSAAMRSADIVYNCRAEVAELFRAASPDHVAFTLNATMALNYAIHALVPVGSRVCVSGYEHNSVIRPLVERKCVLDIVRPQKGRTMLEIWEEHVQKHPVCVIVNHASNVYGYLQPIEKIGNLCSKYNVPLIVDVSQSAGIIDIDISRIPNCTALCMPGHKGLLGPQGTGILVFTDRLPRRALITGGTGSRSNLFYQTPDIPDFYESGTINVPGLAGLLESVRMVRKSGIQKIGEKESRLRSRFAEHIQRIPGVRMIDRPEVKERLSVISVVPEAVSCELIGEKLSENGVAVRTGLHCAPLAHKTEGTLETGTVRISVGWNNTEREIDSAAEILASIMNTF